MPFETTRQQVNRLIDAGLCIRVEGGVIVPKAAMQRHEAIQAAVTNLGRNGWPFSSRLVRSLCV
jgi:hypothetical protein